MTFPLLAILLLAGGLLLARRRDGKRRRLLDLPPSPLAGLGGELAALAALMALLSAVAERGSEPPGRGSPLVAVAVDVSTSMAAGDGSPTRLDRAREEIRSLLSALPDARLALVPFAGEAVVQVAPTADRDGFAFFAENLVAGSVAAPGSAPEEGARAAADLLQGEEGARAVLLLSDGERTLPEASPPLGTGVPVYPVLLGTVHGAPVPGSREAGMSAPAPLTKANPARLEAIAQATGGQVLREAAQLADRLPRSGGPGDSGDRYPWLLPAAALLLLVLRQVPRRPGGTVLLLPATALLLLSLAASCRPSAAPPGEELFREALDLEADGKKTPAGELFARSARFLEGERRGRALYNQGTLALAAGEAREAAELLQDAALLLPGDGEVRTNLALALRSLPDRAAGSAESSTPPSQRKNAEGLDPDGAGRLLREVRPAPGGPPLDPGRLLRERHLERSW